MYDDSSIRRISLHPRGLWELKEEMLVSFDVKGKDPQLKGRNWKTDLAFLFGVLEHLNNLKLHSSGKKPPYARVTYSDTGSQSKTAFILKTNKKRYAYKFSSVETG
jgi:hypothetical protein